MSVADLLAAGMASGGGPAYRRLADALRLAIADGRIPHGSRLPSERSLTAQLALSRTTVTRAYDDMRARGYVSSRRGSGSVAVLPGSRWAATLNSVPPGMLDLTSTAPVAATGLAAAYAAAADDVAASLGGHGYDLDGVAPLREAIARRYAERGAPTDPGQVLIVSGALAGLGIVARALLRPGSRVAVESPTYPGAILALRRAGARLLGVPPLAGSADGSAPPVEAVDVPASRAVDAVAQAAGRGARTAYLIPDVHNPTCASADEPTRAALAAALARHEMTAVVDETLAELSLIHPESSGAAAPRAPRSMAAYAGVVCLGSASKTHWGGLRIGWIRAPWAMLDALRAARLGSDLGAPVLDQLVLAHALAAGPMVDADRRASFRRGRDTLVEALRERLPTWDIPCPEAGLALWCRLPVPSSTALAAAAVRHGVLLAPGASFAAEGRGLEHWLRLPFTLGPRDLERAAAGVSAAWAEVRTAPPREREPRGRERRGRERRGRERRGLVVV